MREGPLTWDEDGRLVPLSDEEGERQRADTAFQQAEPPRPPRLRGVRPVVRDARRNAVLFGTPTVALLLGIAAEVGLQPVLAGLVYTTLVVGATLLALFWLNFHGR